MLERAAHSTISLALVAKASREVHGAFTIRLVVHAIILARVRDFYYPW
jgi:hypothetical protein